jgi:hypothetical protein
MKPLSLITVICISLFVFIMIPDCIKAQQPDRRGTIADNVCISSDEFVLANMINDYRRQNNLTAIPLSKSMFYVAHSHVLDLNRHNGGSSECGLHSWSESGNWTPCCYAKEAGRTNCMNDKPKELTGYKGKGYEIIYWGSEKVVPADVIDFWKSTGVSNDMLLNQGKWKSKIWKSIGVGLVDGYASVWFGDGADQQHGIRICQNDSVTDSTATSQMAGANSSLQTQAPPAKSDHFFLIAGSYKTIQEAEQKLASLRKQGYSRASIIEKDNNFRVAILSYSSRTEAQKVLNKLFSRFKGIWIFSDAADE